MDLSNLSDILSQYSDRQLLELTFAFSVFAYGFFLIYVSYALFDFTYHLIKFIRRKITEKKLRKGSQS